MQQIDPRIIRINVEVNGTVRSYTGLNISAVGTKYDNANQNEAEIRISNLTKATRDYILTETSPFNLNRTPKRITVEAGRQSYGIFRVFSGEVVRATPTQPPDISIILKCLTGNYQKGNLISRNQPAQAKLSTISQQVANDLGVTLDFQALDRVIGNYSFAGAALKQIEKLQQMGKINAFLDDATLVIKEANMPLTNRLKILSLETGMIGIPELTEEGIKVKYLLDNETVLGGGLRIKSTIYPAANGDYTIYKLGFEITNRDDPFYWIAEGKRQ